MGPTTTTTAAAATAATTAATTTTTTTITASPMIHHRHGASCDESRCVSRGRSDLFNLSFTCYGDGIAGNDYEMVFPMMCADGLLPWVIEDDEPSQLATTGFDPLDSLYKEDASVQYFTCCQPDHNNLVSFEAVAMNATRRCSDPFTAPVHDRNIAEAVCKNQQVTRKHPRWMETNDRLGGGSHSFVCCDSIVLPVEDNITMTVDDNNHHHNTNITNGTTTFLNDVVECVPYNNDFYDPAVVRQHEFGSILFNPISCTFPDNEFRFPRPIGTNDTKISSTGWYQCCKTGPALLLPFVQHTAAFRIEIYTYLVLYSIAAVASLLVVIGLLIPLLIQLKNGSYKRATAAAAASGRNRRKRKEQQQLPYSTYNLYVIYLAIPDLGFLLYFLSQVGRAIHQTLLQEWKEVFDFLVFAYVYTNMCINAIVCYQLLLLLRNSHSGQRTNPPSLLRVNFQCGAVYVLSVAYSWFNRYGRPRLEASSLPALVVTAINDVSSGLLMIFPFGYILYVSLVVWYRGYIPSKTGAIQHDRAMRQLSIYFFRILGIFLVVWLPFLVALVSISQFSWLPFVLNLAPPIQAMLTTCAILTKDDVRNYIWDLVTLSYIYERKNSKKSDNNKSKTPLPTTTTIVASQEVSRGSVSNIDLVMPA